jgi:hypothetical protein
MTRQEEDSSSSIASLIRYLDREEEPSLIDLILIDLAKSAPGDVTSEAKQVATDLDRKLPARKTAKELVACEDSGTLFFDRLAAICDVDPEVNQLMTDLLLVERDTDSELDRKLPARTTPQELEMCKHSRTGLLENLNTEEASKDGTDFRLGSSPYKKARFDTPGDAALGETLVIAGLVQSKKDADIDRELPARVTAKEIDLYKDSGTHLLEDTRTQKANKHNDIFRVATSPRAKVCLAAPEDAALMALAASIQQEIYQQDKQQEDSAMRTTNTGKAWIFVERVLQLHRSLEIDPSLQFDTVATDDMVFLTKPMLEVQEIYYLEGKPTQVDIGYHFTRKENIDRIKMVRKLPIFL